MLRKKFGAGLRKAVQDPKPGQGAAFGKAAEEYTQQNQALVDGFRQSANPSFERLHTPIVR